MQRHQPDEFVPRVEVLVTALQGESLPVETSAALMQHYERAGDYAKAEPLFRQALEIRKKALGEEHPYYAFSLNNLAGLYPRKGHCLSKLYNQIWTC